MFAALRKGGVEVKTFTIHFLVHNSCQEYVKNGKKKFIFKKK